MTALARFEHRFERVCSAVIMGNTAVVGWGIVDRVHTELTEHLESACLAFFVLEMVLRMACQRGGFVRRPLNVFDALVIVLSVSPMVGADASLLRMARLARLVHLGRHVSSLRTVRFVRRLAPVAAALLAALVLRRG